MVIILLGAFALRVSGWGRNRFLEDEALYAVWGMQIATGADPMLDHEPVDKPPLFPYALALSFLTFGGPTPATAPAQVAESAARLPSLIASMSGIALICAIGRKLYGATNAGIVAAALLAFSPFDILFSSTAFTDPTMVAFAVASVLAAVSGRWGLAGLTLGLATATKQQGLYFLPLVLGLGLAAQWKTPRRSSPQRSERARARQVTRAGLIARRLWRQPWLRFLGGFSAVAAVVLWWDASRLQRPGYLQQSLISYGEVGWAPVRALAGRGHSWSRWFSYFWASPFSWALLSATLAVWLLRATLKRNDTGIVLHSRTRPSAADLVIALFIAAFMLVHWSVELQTWDRYLLGLVPLAALLFGHAFAALPTVIASPRWRRGTSAAMGLLVAASLAGPALQAARSQLPPGGDHGAYDGIEALAAYVRTQAPADAVLYHFWLGYHYRFYLYGTPLRLHWYPDLADLVNDASVYRREPRYIGFPTWRDSSRAEHALADAGIRLAPEFETVRRDGTRSFRLFKLVGP